MFILYADWSVERSADDDDEFAAMMDAHRRYYAYLESNRAKFPQKAYELATSSWRHNFSDHRALHDSWVQSFQFSDDSLPRAGKDRKNSLEIVLLGAYHDGHIVLCYENVSAFNLSHSDVREGPTEIYRDEIRLSEAGRVLHEIELLARDNWLIECEDMGQRWEPFTDTSTKGK